MKYFKYIFNGINALGITTTTEAGNMAYQVGNDFDNVKNNREELYKELGIDRYQVVYVHQSHSDIIQEATRQDGFRGGEDFASGVPADALYTKEKDLALAIFHADCVPIIFYDSTVPLIGVIHSGFKGTLKHITLKALRKVINEEHLKPENINIIIGPYRHKETFLLSQEDFENVISAYLPIGEDGHIDLLDGIKFDLACLGIPINNIKDINIDTTKDDRCFSAYKKEPVGRMITMVLLK